MLSCKTYKMSELTVEELAAMTVDPAICLEYTADGKIKVWIRE
jgi:hypothetical protein